MRELVCVHVFLFEKHGQQLLPPHWLDCCWDEFSCLLLGPFPALSPSVYLSICSPHLTCTLFCHSCSLLPGLSVQQLSHISEDAWCQPICLNTLHSHRKFQILLFSISSSALSRSAVSMHRWAGNVSSVCSSWWWSWWSATCCAGCHMASWLCWPPSVRLAWSHLRRASSHQSWPRRARSSTPSSMSSWISRWVGGRELLWLRSVPLILCWFNAAGGGELSEASHPHCFHRWLFDVVEMRNRTIFLLDATTLPSWHWIISIVCEWEVFIPPFKYRFKDKQSN